MPRPFQLSGGLLALLVAVILALGINLGLIIAQHRAVAEVALPCISDGNLYDSEGHPVS
jgi:hypothetical protein